MLGIEELYRRYRDDVYRYLVSLTHDSNLAEDLLSETFLCAMQKAGTFRGQSSEKIWLFGIARNLWLQSLQKNRPTVEYSDLLGVYMEDQVGKITTSASWPNGWLSCWTPCRSGNAPLCSCVLRVCPTMRSLPVAVSGRARPG